MFSIKTNTASGLRKNYNVPVYSIFLLKEKAEFSINFVKYRTKARSIVFLSPYQNLVWLGERLTSFKLLQFHGDFYCIEYHKKEVACNGLLFNNIYSEPCISLHDGKFQELEELVHKMEKETQSSLQFSDAVLKSYLQLVLAISSKEKALQIDSELVQQPFENEILKFQQLLETHFVQQRNPSFYASELAMSVSSFGKKTKHQFGKTPTQLIQERVVLEAKKLLHLTHKSVKEVAAELNFDDEFYFSRYFKKAVGLSPSHFREATGISIVAK